MKEVHNTVAEFADQVVVRIMRLNKGQVFKGCGGALKPDFANIKDYLNTVQEVVQQGCTNQNL